MMMMREKGFAIAQSVVRTDPSKLAFTIAAINDLSVRVTPATNIVILKNTIVY